MPYTLWLHKYKYYRVWYEELTFDERTGKTGLWILERIQIFDSLLKCEEINAAIWIKNVRK